MAIKVILLSNIYEQSNSYNKTKNTNPNYYSSTYDMYCKTIKTGMDGCIYVLYNSNSIISVIF